MNTEQNRSPLSDDRNVNDRDWIAFQYIAGELTVAEADAFDERLATDQDAREAVARRTVQLAESTVLAFESTPALATQARWWARPTVWATCGVAAAIVIAVSLMGVRQSPSEHNGNSIQIADGQGEVRELAMAWATGRTDLMTDIGDATEEALAGVGAAGEEVENIETPSWMLVAVAGLTQNNPLSPEHVEQGLE